MFDPLFNGLANLLAFFYDYWPSYGVAIVLFTLTIMLALTPLSIKSTRSMIAMQRVQPELKKLQQKHKGDREALNKEMMAFYQENNINPFSSCLPLLLQMPVFIVLYQVLSGLTRRGDNGNFNPKYFEGEDAPLAVALRATDKMMSFGMDLSKGAIATLQDDGVITALPYITLVGLVALTAWYQQRQIQGRNLNRDTPINPQQQMITKVMPFIFIPISISLPAGVVIYFVVSNLVRIGQQALVTKLEFGDKAEGSGGAAKGANPKAPKPSTDGAIDTTSRPAKPAKGPEKGTGSGDENGAGPRAGGRSPANGSRSGAASSRPRNRKRKRK